MEEDNNNHAEHETKHHEEKHHETSENKHHETKHHEVKPKKDETVSISKVGIWKLISSILLILLIAAIYTGGFGRGTTGSSGSDAAPAQPAAARPAPSNEPAIEVSAIPDDDNFLGPDDAEIVVVEFSDYECPFCAAAMGYQDQLIARFKGQDPTWEPAVPGLKELAKQGKIKFVFRDFPLSIHSNAQKASEAAECAGDQDKYWEMHDILFESGVAGGVDQYKGYAADIGLDTAAFDECLDSGKFEAEVKKDLADGVKLGVSGTPAYFINGQLVSGAQSFSVFDSIING